MPVWTLLLLEWETVDRPSTMNSSARDLYITTDD